MLSPSQEEFYIIISALFILLKTGKSLEFGMRKSLTRRLPVTGLADSYNNATLQSLQINGCYVTITILAYSGYCIAVIIN